jgi:hypothetical protein
VPDVATGLIVAAAAPQELVPVAPVTVHDAFLEPVPSSKQITSPAWSLWSGLFSTGVHPDGSLMDVAVAPSQLNAAT